MEELKGSVGRSTNPDLLQNDWKEAVYTIWIRYKKNSRTKNLLKKSQTHKKLNLGKHPMLRFNEKHNLAIKLFLFNKETQVEIFFESVFGKSKCDCQC
jgi:hypothetical protein